MSDYLWDKSGETDAEVERLEELLGGLRYRPQEFELPPEIEAGEPEQRVRRFVFRTSFAVVAAALLLMLFVGLWLGVLRHNGGTDETRIALRPEQVAT
ncbi:MAG: hypothetical protein LC754_00785, partial [Acidobacteria bacterium]|nr:hypothetical protein [Acidobacteriota bacterium]